MVIDDSRTSPSNILYGEYIKYDRMYEMSMHAFNGHDIIKEVEVYVDLYSILRKLYIFGDNKLDLNDQYEIAASIINLGIHIRGFFNRFGIASKIYLIYGEAKPQNILNKLLDMVIREDIQNNREELLNTIDEIQMQRMW